jgi:DNA mismatch repair protein MutL
VGKPSFGQKSRSRQWLFLNGRYIQSKALSHAVASAYEFALDRGSFPFFVLNLELDPRQVDINVHPAKLEAKFEREQELYREIQAVTRAALAGGAHVPAISLEGLEAGTGRIGTRFTDRQHDPVTSRASHVDRATGEIITRLSVSGKDLAATLLADSGRAGAAGGPATDPPGADAAGEWADTAPVWQLATRYILTKISSGLLLVDQHVAHERVLYEAAHRRLRQGTRDAQQLLFPVTMGMNPSEFSLCSELRGELEALGFDLRPFGATTIIVDGIPADVKSGDIETMLREILVLYGEYQQSVTPDAHEALLKSYACRAAVKAGDVLSEDEMRQLLHDLYATTMPYVCPHGRPVLLRLSTEELDRRFGRR